jgi:hypothetical protein
MSRRTGSVRPAVCVLILALATACGSAAPAAGPTRYGISIDVPEGWHGEITRGTVRLGTTPPGTELGTDDVAVTLFEYEIAPPDSAASAAETFDGAWPVRFGVADVAAADSRGAIDDANAPGRRAVLVHGRYFNVFLESGSRAVSERRIDELNDALARIEVEAGDFYQGSAEPVVFPEREGWHTVSTGPTPRYAHGEYVQTAAATIPYRNGPNDLPPARTLEALPRDGVLLWVGLTRYARFPPSRWDGKSDTFKLRQAPPYQLADLERLDGWEGQVRDIPEYRLWATSADQYQVDLRVYFGRGDPTEAMLTEADAVLRSLRFPNWGPWELEP